MADDILPVREHIPNYEGGIKYGVRPSDGMDAFSTMYAGVSTDRIKIVPTDPPPPFPSSMDWITPVTYWESLGNDRIGNCVPAAMAHALEGISGAAQGPRIDITEAQTVQAYSAITGYNPQTGANDNGTSMASAMNYWVSSGLAGNKITVSTASNAMGHWRFYADFIRRSVHLFGCSMVSFHLPDSAEYRFRNGIPWSEGMGPGTTYHCVPIMAYDGTHCEFITWGRPFRATWGFVEEHLSELWTVLSPLWKRNGEICVSGYEYSRLSRWASQNGLILAS